MPVPVPPAAAPNSEARDMAHAIQQGQRVPGAWLTPEELNERCGTQVQVHTGGDQGVRILDPRVADVLHQGQDEEHVC